MIGVANGDGAVLSLVWAYVDTMLLVAVVLFFMLFYPYVKCCDRKSALDFCGFFLAAASCGVGAAITYRVGLTLGCVLVNVPTACLAGVAAVGFVDTRPDKLHDLRVTLAAALNLDVSAKARKWAAFVAHAVCPVTLACTAACALQPVLLAVCVVWLWMRFVHTFQPSEGADFLARAVMAAAIALDFADTTLTTPRAVLAGVNAVYAACVCANLNLLVVPDLAKSLYASFISGPWRAATE